MNVAGAGFDELRELCTAAGDKASLAIGMATLVMDHAYHARIRGEAAELDHMGPHRVDRRSEPDGRAVLAGDLRQEMESAEYSRHAAVEQRVIDLADG